MPSCAQQQQLTCGQEPHQEVRVQLAGIPVQAAQVPVQPGRAPLVRRGPRTGQEAPPQVPQHLGAHAGVVTVLEPLGASQASRVVWKSTRGEHSWGRAALSLDAVCQA